MSAARRFTLTPTGYAAIWYLDQQAALAARPAGSTAPCACCETVYPTKGLKPLASDAAYAQAQQVRAFDRNAPVCKFCQEDFVCSCWACRQASNDLAPIPADIAEAVDALEGWGNEDDGEGQYCADCRAEWQRKYGDNDD
jgi:hypothetical protein